MGQRGPPGRPGRAPGAATRTSRPPARSTRAERRRGASRPKARRRGHATTGHREWQDDDATTSRGRSRSRRAATRPAQQPTASAAEAIAALSGRSTLPPEIATEIRNAADVATARHQEHLVERAESAYGAYERDRFQDALRAIKPVADEAPSVAAVRELAGLAAYRCGRWRSAAGHLEAFGRLSDSAEHLPVLMDCQRALHKPKKVAALWAELRQSSPDPDVLAEGRIVAAASLADAGDLNGAIAMLSTAGASKALRNPSERHVRQWYLLADLYERAGDVPKAREYFERVFRSDPEAYDVAERLRGLGPERRPRNRPRPDQAVGLDEDGPAHTQGLSRPTATLSYRDAQPGAAVGGIVVAGGAVVVAAGGAGGGGGRGPGPSSSWSSGAAPCRSSGPRR